MQFVCGWFIFIILSVRSEASRPKRFFVHDYGAYPNDGIDDSKAIQAAVNDAIEYGSVSDIHFDYGNYSITTTTFIHDATNINVIGKGIDQTFLIGNKQVSIFSAQNCQGLVFTSFSIDYDPLPFTAGYVVNVNDQFLDVQVVPPHQTDVDRQVQAILRYDPVQMRPAYGSNTYEIYQTPPDTKTSIVSPDILRIPLHSRTNFVKGDPIVARYTYQGHAIFGQDLTDITIQSIAIYAAWGMGFVTLRSRRLTINNYTVLQRSGRWMSSIIDCMHFTDTREYLSLSNSVCQGMGDDGLNVHGVFFSVRSVIDPKTIIMETKDWGGPLDVGVGTSLEFTSSQQPFTVHASGTVASIADDSSTSRKVTFTGSVNVNVGDWVCVSDTPLLTIRNFTVSHNRARGVLLETRNIDIQHSVFNRTSGPAILIQPSMYWREGPEARNVSLIKNLYILNNEGIAQQKGVISILPDPIQLPTVINDIRIESSSFHLGMYSQGLLQSDNANSVFLSGNYISINNQTSLISICNSRNISADNNCAVHTETITDQYYTYDNTNPCSSSMSSLINLPASAFNSSFPPPVFYKESSHEYY